MLPGRSARNVPVFAVHAEAGKHHRLRVPPVRRNWAVFQLHRVCRCLADRALPQPERPPRQPECFPIRLGRSRNGALRSVRFISVVFYLSFRAFFRFFTQFVVGIKF
uniref:(northern house mosquito) hypothetical protein n=1 Tax=Culex pipiens TaxID=7175 RepID=A0A8D8FWH8_CULPI